MCATRSCPDSPTSRSRIKTYRAASTPPGSSISSVASAPRSRRRRPTPQSFEAALEDVRVSVAADVARNYFELRGIQQQLSVLDRSLANQRETLRLTKVRRDAGIGEEQDVASASARVVGDRGGACRRCGPRWPRAKHRLAVLTGGAPGQLARRSGAARVPGRSPRSIALGPPDQLLNGRPDVRAAERHAGRRGGA